MFRRSNLKDLEEYDPFDGTRNSYNSNFPEKTPTRNRKNRFESYHANTTADFESFLKLPEKGDLLTSLPSSPSIPLVSSTPATHFKERATGFGAAGNAFAPPELTPRARRALTRSTNLKSPLTQSMESAAQHTKPRVKRTPLRQSNLDAMDVEEDDGDRFVMAPSSFFLQSVKKARQYFGRISSAISPFVARQNLQQTENLKLTETTRKTPYSHLEAEYGTVPVRRSPRIARRRYQEQETIAFELETAPQERTRRLDEKGVSYGLLDLFVVFPIKLVYFLLNCLVSVVKAVEAQVFRALPTPYRVREVFSALLMSSFGTLLSQVILSAQRLFKFLHQPFGLKGLAVIGGCVLLYAMQQYSWMPSQDLSSAPKSADSAATHTSPPSSTLDGAAKWKVDSSMWDELRARVVFREDWEQQLIMIRGKQQQLEGDVAKAGQRIDSLDRETRRRVQDAVTGQHALSKKLEEFRRVYEETVAKLAMRDAVPPWPEFLAVNRDGLTKFVQGEIPDVRGIATEAVAGVIEAAVVSTLHKQLLKNSLADLGSFNADFAHVSRGGKVLLQATSPSVAVRHRRASGDSYGTLKLLQFLGFTLDKSRSVFSAPRMGDALSNAAHEALIGPDHWIGKQPGQCWPMAGSRGTLGVHIGQTIYPSAFTLEHIPRDMSPSGDAGLASAPRMVRIYGVYNLSAFLDLKRQDNDLGRFVDNEAAINQTLETAPTAVLLAKHEYSPFLARAHKLVGVAQTQPPNFQTVSLLESAQQLLLRYGPLQNFILSVQSNWGRPEFTCLYRFRIHGEAFANAPTPSRTS